MEQQALLIPSEFYYVAGVVLLCNVGTIITLMFAAVKVVWWASKIDSEVKEAKACSVRAHKRIDQVETKINE